MVSVGNPFIPPCSFSKFLWRPTEPPVLRAWVKLSTNATDGFKKWSGQNAWPRISPQTDNSLHLKLGVSSSSLTITNKRHLLTDTVHLQLYVWLSVATGGNSALWPSSHRFFDICKISLEMAAATVPKNKEMLHFELPENVFCKKKKERWIK